MTHKEALELSRVVINARNELINKKANQYDDQISKWVAYYRTEYGEQIGDCAYGTSKASAIFNLTVQSN